MSDSIEDLRNEIDAIDGQLLQLLNQRATKSLEVKKTAGGKAVLRRGRETAIVRRMVADNQGPFSDEAIQNIFETIVYNGRGLQTTLRVAYLGPAGTYSEQALHAMFGEAVEPTPKRSLREAMQALGDNAADIAVLPVENSTEGAVAAAHKLLRESPWPIIAELTLNIKHALLSKGSEVAELTKIYGHPQALGQCRDWLATHVPDAELVECASNAQGLELAKTPDTAAIAGEHNAVRFELNILETSINDDTDNATRFVALARDPVPATGDDKTSVYCTVHDKPGALYELLGVLNAQSLSMTRLESQPDSGGYGFFIDFVGHKDDATVGAALTELEAKTANCKLLGSYPREMI